ncbi:hypothetical protein N8Z56_01775 [Pelagibacteraceae bacterium]|jgi:hypothetical protein|nr:hypothetical protein [Pelagibacteraceae bacterium]|tara:strand:+ start:261 stop:719 length:459 start_codon:yes stop_codon:yes gene_type:complete
MKKVSFFLILKLFITLLLTYNIAAVSILYFPSTNIKNLLWKWTPYNYEQSLYFPNNLSNLSLLNMNNRLLIISFLNKNSYKDYLDIDFWNYKKILESFDRNNIKNLEKSFYKAFILSKNNQKINIELRKYFIQNYSKFSNEYKNKILKSFLN